MNNLESLRDTIERLAHEPRAVWVQRLYKVLKSSSVQTDIPKTEKPIGLPLSLVESKGSQVSPVSPTY
jgi:hypothetical protein